MDRANFLQSIAAELASGIGVRRIEQVQQAVREAPQGLRIWFGRADVHAAIYLRRIHAHQRKRETLRQLQGQRGFARGGWPHHKQHGLHHGHSAPAPKAPIQFFHAQLHPRRAAMITLAAALSIFHIA